MAQISPNHDNNNNLLQNDVAQETTNIFTSLFTPQDQKTLISPPPSPHCDSSRHAPLPTLPFELIIEILSRLPVKSLMQFKCVSQSWKTLILDPQFKRKHLLARNTTHLALGFKYPCKAESLTRSYSLQSVLKSSGVVESRIDFPLIDGHRFDTFVGSCDGMLCFTITININQIRVLLWNPSIHECFMLTPLINEIGESLYTMYGFGYDNFSHCYKVVAVYCYRTTIHRKRVGLTIAYKTLVRVHSYGTGSWRRIEEFPSGVPFNSPGKFVSGALHWLAPSSVALSSRVIVSLDLGTESYQEVLQPDYGDVAVLTLNLGVLRDCLSLLAHCGMFSDIWVMKDYGNEESWTKLACVPSYMGTPNSFPYSKVLFISEDDEVLLEYHSSLVVYNSRNGTFKIPEIEDIVVRVAMPEVYVESLISPC